MAAGLLLVVVAGPPMVRGGDDENAPVRGGLEIRAVAARGR